MATSWGASVKFPGEGPRLAHTTPACAIKEAQYSLQLLTWATHHLPIYLMNFMNLRTLHMCHLNDKGSALERLPQEWCTSLGSPSWWLFKIPYRKNPRHSTNWVIFTRHQSQQILIKVKISCRVHREHRVHGNSSHPQYAFTQSHLVGPKLYLLSS